MSTDCACLYGDSGDDPPSFFCEHWVVARKPHICAECRETIPPGARYKRARGRWGGEFGTYSTCATCHEIRAALYCGGEWCFTLLWEDIHDQIFSETGLTVGCIDKLTTPEAKAVLQRKWMAYVEKHAS